MEPVMNGFLEKEANFLQALNEKMKMTDLNTASLSIRRMADRTLNVCFNGYQIGRIKLAGRATKMQCLVRGVEWLENEPFDTYLKRQSDWVDLASYYKYTQSVPLWEPTPLPFDEWKKQKAGTTPFET